MKVLTAKDYGYRKVVRVLMNDTDPQWVHPDGPSPTNHTGDTEDPDTTKEVCQECRNNWNVLEFIFQGDTLTNEYVVTPAVDGVLATEDELAVASEPAVMGRRSKTDKQITSESLKMAEATVISVREMSIN